MLDEKLSPPTSTTSTARRDSTLVSEGWGAKPPSDKEIDAMVDWLDGPGTSAGAAMEDAASALDEIMDAMRVRDTSALKAASMKPARTLGNQLPGVLPTPDPDLNRALQAVLDDGIELNSAIQAFADPPTTEQANARRVSGSREYTRVMSSGS